MRNTTMLALRALAGMIACGCGADALGPDAPASEVPNAGPGGKADGELGDMPFVLSDHFGLYMGDYAHGFFRTRSDCFASLSDADGRLAVRLYDREGVIAASHDFEGIPLDEPIEYRREGLTNMSFDTEGARLTMTVMYLRNGDLGGDPDVEGPQITDLGIAAPNAGSFHCSMMVGGDRFFRAMPDAVQDYIRACVDPELTCEWRDPG